MDRAVHGGNQVHHARILVFINCPVITFFSACYTDLFANSEVIHKLVLAFPHDFFTDTEKTNDLNLINFLSPRGTLLAPSASTLS